MARATTSSLAVRSRVQHVTRRTAIVGAALALGLTVSSIDRSNAQSLNAASVERVDLALVLAIDASWSVNGAEYTLQIEGMARAFQDEQILAAIEKGRLKRIAVTVVQWASETQQSVSLPWQIISSTAEAHAVAARIQAMPRAVSDGGTSIAAALKFSARLILDAPFKFSRAVIDIATDGRNNNGGDPRPVRDLIGGAGITVNGLTILTEFPTLNKYFEEHIATGPYSFVVTANSYAGYARAIRKKLLKEIQGPPIS